MLEQIVEKFDHLLTGNNGLTECSMLFLSKILAKYKNICMNESTTKAHA